MRTLITPLWASLSSLSLPVSLNRPTRAPPLATPSPQTAVAGKTRNVIGGGNAPSSAMKIGTIISCFDDARVDALSECLAKARLSA
jgi:hypothetical protein